MNYIVDKSQIKCSCGEKVIELSVNNQDISCIKDEKIATINDHKEFINIPTFGFCSVLKLECNPEFFPWENYSTKFFIKDIPVLTINSYCRCIKGGIINILNSGDNNSKVIEE